MVHDDTIDGTDGARPVRALEVGAASRADRQGSRPVPGAPHGVVRVAALHGGLFVLLGMAAAWLVSRYTVWPSLPALFVALFAALEGACLLGSEVVVPGVAGEIGHAPIAAANALAAFAMALYLRRSEPRPAHPTGAVVLRRERS